MAHSLASPPDPLEPRERGLASQTDAPDEAATNRSLSRYLTALSVSGGGSLSAEVALDLVLNEIVERACQATQASGAAIALARDGEMVCRATTGENAPDIGSRLSTSYGLSAACVRTGERQICNDTENDSRVDSAICRRLGVRSILVVPVWRSKELTGVLEIFSGQPNGFSDRHIQTLQSFAREISDNVNSTAKLQAPKPEPHLMTEPAGVQGSEPLIAASKSEPSDPTLPRDDFLSTALLLCVILLAVFLGWVVGRSEWRRVALKSMTPPSHVAQGGASEPSVPDSSTVAATTRRTTRESQGLSDSSARDADTDDGLVVSRNGKVIFRSTAPGSNNNATPLIQGTEQPTAKPPRLRIPEEIAREYLATKVEPEYPQRARQRHIQGSVVLDAWVDKAGNVIKITPVSGNHELVTAAARAVAQWRFHPFFYEGQPEDFTTKITVVFRLP